VPVYVPEPLTKRMVLRHTSGLHQILGTCTEQPAAFLPLMRADVDGVPVAINLIASKPRYYLYAVVEKPAGLGHFHPEQR